MSHPQLLHSQTKLTLSFADRSSNRLPIQVLQDSKDSITSIVIRDHLVVASSVDGYLRTWDLRMGQLSKDFFERELRIHSSHCSLSRN